jgi:hypothetical protein
MASFDCVTGCRHGHDSILPPLAAQRAAQGGPFVVVVVPVILVVVN